MTNDANIYMSLGQVAKVASGYPLRTSADALASGDIRFIQLKHVSTDSGIDWDAIPQVALPTTRTPVWLNDGDVIFASRGTRTFAYPLVNTPPKTVCAPQFFVLSIKDTGKVSPEFVAWQINQRAAQDYFQKNATGSYILNIRREVVESLQLTLPPIQQQQLIVEFWRAAQSERALINRLIENRQNQLEAIALRLLQQPRGQQ